MNTTKSALTASAVTWLLVFLFFPVPDGLTQIIYATPVAMLVLLGLIVTLRSGRTAHWTIRKRRTVVWAVALGVAAISIVGFHAYVYWRYPS